MSPFQIFNHTLDSESVHWLAKPFKAYNVRLRPTRWNASICLKVELYGCEDLKTKSMRSFTLNNSVTLQTLDVFGSASTIVSYAVFFPVKVSCILPLGMESGFITDAALSTSLNNGNPYDSRLGKKVNGYGGWLANPFASQDYLQIDLAVLYSFTKIAVEGPWNAEVNSFVRKYTVMMSNDTLVWQNYTENGKLKVILSRALSIQTLRF